MLTLRDLIGLMAGPYILDRFVLGEVAKIWSVGGPMGY